MLAPVVAVAATVTVVAVVVIAGGHHAEPTLPGPAPAPSAHVPSPVSLLPSRGGMHGLLLGVSVAGSGSTLRVSFVQCPNCGNPTPPDESWSPASYPCPAGTLMRDLTSTTAGAVWVTCAHPTTTRAGKHPSPKRPNPPLTVQRSGDGGHHWQTPNPAFHAAADLVAASPQIAWADSTSGALQRTTNGGRSWQTVLRGAGPAPAIDIESSTTATVVATATAGTPAAHTRRTELVAYRTVDGGSHWTHTLIQLPTG